MRTPAAAALALLLALAAALSGCSSGSGAKPAREPSAAAGEAGLTADQLVALFAGAGIPTYAGTAAKAPLRAAATPGRLRLLRWQVETMTRQLDARLGYRGTDLDALTEAPGTVPASVLLAAYVTAGQTPGAEASRTLMGDQDFAAHAREIVYPGAVLAFFAGDLAGPSAGTPYGGGSSGCAGLRTFLAGTLKPLATALDNPPGDLLDSLWDTATEIAHSAARLTLPTLTAPVEQAAGRAATLLAVLSSASGLLDPWTVTTRADPDPAHFGIGSGRPVTVTADLTTATAFAWPADVRACATVAGAALPDPAGARSGPVTWTVRPAAVVTVAARDSRAGADGTAVLRLTTGTETRADHEKGELDSVPVAVSVVPGHARVRGLAGLVGSLFLDALPDLASAGGRLTTLVAAGGPVTWTTVNHHGPAATATASPTATATCPSTGVAVLPDGTWTGPVTLDVQGSGASAAFSTSQGTGTMTLVVAQGRIARGTWNLTWTSAGRAESGPAAATVDLTVRVTGQARGPASLPVVTSRWRLRGTATVTKPVRQTVAIDESGRDSGTMTVESTSCDTATGTFLTSLRSKEAGAAFTGTARWVGTRKD